MASYTSIELENNVTISTVTINYRMLLRLDNLQRDFMLPRKLNLFPMVKRQVTCTYAKHITNFSACWRFLTVPERAHFSSFFSRSVHSDDSFYLLAA